MDGRTDGRIIDGWKAERKESKMDGWMDGQKNE